MIADFTKLVCCRDPGSPCPAEDAFKNWKWDDAVSGEMHRNIYLVRGKDRGRPAWHYVLLSSGDEDHVQGFKEQCRTGDINVANWGYVIVSGWGEDPPDKIRDILVRWTYVCWWFLSTFSYTLIHSIIEVCCGIVRQELFKLWVSGIILCVTVSVLVTALCYSTMPC